MVLPNTDFPTTDDERATVDVFQIAEQLDEPINDTVRMLRSIRLTSNDDRIRPVDGCTHRMEYIRRPISGKGTTRNGNTAPIICSR